MDKNMKLDSLPEEIKLLLDKELLQTLGSGTVNTLVQLYGELKNLYLLKIILAKKDLVCYNTLRQMNMV